MAPFLLGAGAAVMALAGLVFLRMWRSTADRFFLLFALSFFLQAANRGMSTLRIDKGEEPDSYWIRLMAYLLILAAIVLKNRSARAAH